MSLIRSIVMFCLLAVLGSSCVTARLGSPNVAVSHSAWIGASWFASEGYAEQPEVDKKDFQPTGGSMGVKSESHMAEELNFVVDLRLRVAPWAYMGVTSNYLSFYSSGVDGACTFYNCRTVRYSTIDWWNIVLAKDVIVKYGPSIGYVIGLMLGDPELKMISEYSISARRYETIVGIYEGINCVDCHNGSRLKTSTTISSGVAWRNTFRIGSEILSGIGWFEIASDQVSFGFGLQLAAPLFGWNKKDENID